MCPPCLRHPILVFLDPSICRDRHYLPGQELSTVFQCRHCRPFQAATAGHLHTHNGNALDRIISDNLGEFLRVVHWVQLGAANPASPDFG